METKINLIKSLGLLIVFVFIFSLPHAYAEDLSFSDGRALMKVLKAEYKARATYKYIMEDLGNYRPFPRLVKLKERHIAYLQELLRRNDLDVPKDNWKDIEPKFANIKEACQDGLRAEKYIATLYGRLLKKVKNEEVKQFFELLRKFSSEDFVKDFKRCIKDSEVD